MPQELLVELNISAIVSATQNRFSHNEHFFNKKKRQFSVAKGYLIS